MQSRNVCPVFDTGTDVITGRKQKFRRCVQKGTSPLDCLPAPIALQLAHACPHRRSPDAPDECWHVYFGDVRVGTIAIRTGIPHHEDPWGWACGFYPGGHPAECTSGAAATFDQARVEFEDAWRVFLRSERKPISRHGALSAIGPRANMRCGKPASGCRRRNQVS